MSSQIHTQLSSFGHSSDFADTLIIDISDNSFHFCELQSGNNSPFYVCYFPINSSDIKLITDQLLMALNHFGLTKKSYKTVLVNLVSPHFTLCPATFFESNNARSILEFNSGDTERKLILTDDVNSTIKLIYCIDESLKSMLDKLFPQHHLKHNVTVLSRIMLSAEELVKENILISVRENCIEVIVKQNNQLLLANQYFIKTNEDILYYVLFILEQYQLNPLTANITLVGNIEANSELIISLKKYVKSIRLASGHKTLNWEYLTGMPQHFNFTLLNRLFCE